MLFSRNLLKFLQLVFAVALCGATTGYADSQDINAIGKDGAANQFFSHLEDAASDLTIDSILENTYQDLFTPGVEGVLNKGYSNSSFWLHGRFHLQEDATPTQRFLSIEYSLLDEVELYVAHNSELVQQWQTGDSRPFASRPIDSSWFLFPVDFKPGETLDIYIRVKSTSSLRLPISIWEPSTFYDTQRPKLLTDGVYFGILFLMFIYNLCLLATVRDVSYFYYITYILSLGTFQLCMTGYGFEYIWPEQPQINEFMLPFSVCAVGLFILAFGQRVMDLRNNSQLMYYLFNILVVLEAAAALVSLVLPYELVIRTVIGFALLVSSIMLIGAIQESLKGNPTAKLFLLAYFTLMLGAVALASASMGWLPANFLTMNSLMIGSAVEIVVLSFALAERLHQINKEKARMERESKQNLKEMNDRLIQANQLKDEFLATISHELRTPMNGVLGCLQHLQHIDNDQKQNPYLNFADHSARQMMMMVDSLLAYTELQSGKLSIQSEPLKIHELIERSQSLFTDNCAKRGIQLNVTISEDTPLILFGDPLRLSQIINNLLDNAVKFTHEGHIDVSIESRTIQSESRLMQLEIRVADTGAGIAPENHDAIFETFRNNKPSPKRSYGGLGIGLTVVKSLLDKMGGSIHFTSQANVGTTFTVSIPCHYQTSNINGRNEEHSRHIHHVNSALSVLVVEDNPVNQLVIKGLLNKHGYEIFSANNGEEALERLEKHTVDIVLMDCQMPIMDGFEATRKIRSLNKQYSNLPIIAVTANAMSEDRHLCLQAGMNDYLCKPIDAQILNRKIVYWSNRKPTSLAIG